MRQSASSSRILNYVHSEICFKTWLEMQPWLKVQVIWTQLAEVSEVKKTFKWLKGGGGGECKYWHHFSLKYFEHFPKMPFSCTIWFNPTSIQIKFHSNIKSLSYGVYISLRMISQFQQLSCFINFPLKSNRVLSLLILTKCWRRRGVCFGCKKVSKYL